MISSMSRKGNGYDPTCIESFHGILKRELVYQTKFKTREEVKKSLFEYIEFFYNSKRMRGRKFCVYFLDVVSIILDGYW
ncbi:IS3 family transposase [Bacillus xiapuensis]|uniref:IS3 family transposase n=1 Tax=Bacillus xiapuensis TaxID=2014075 RepID=UPI0038B90B37